ncbi:MAG: shikimate dehydrogenase [Candidatus Gastranaerophilales bacterium]|nr:shikimate dehydrogenase [Candidatus Gastranaerophilales bacterium]
MENELNKLALIGYPLSHSLSPILYKTAFQDLGISGSYEILPTESEDLINRIKYLRINKYFGFNVTIPHKVPMTLFLSKYDEFVNLTGAVNTIKIEEDLSLSGFNTDVWGFMEAIPKNVDLKGKFAAIVGTGGAARAVCAGLYKLGIKKIDIYTRNIVDSKNTMDTLRSRFPDIEFKAIQLSMMQGLENIDILVNTTPIGMKNFDEDSSAVDDKNIETLPKNAIVYDIVYNPLKTALISKAIKYNKRYITGLDMLIFQAVRACEIWFGQKPDYKSMKIAALEEFLMK